SRGTHLSTGENACGLEKRTVDPRSGTACTVSSSCDRLRRVPPRATDDSASITIHLVDGTYELFRHFYGLRRFHKGTDPQYGAEVGVLQTVLQMIESGETHVGVATDHVIESFRNDLWAGYKTGEGIEPALLAQFHPLEDALAAMGVVV